jgi:hypothetical protein
MAAALTKHFWVIKSHDQTMTRQSKAYACWLFCCLLLCTWALAACVGAPPIHPVEMPTALTQPPSTATNAPIPATSLRLLSTEQQLQQAIPLARNVPDLAMRLRPEVERVPLVVSQTPPSYEIGERLEFWVHNPASGQNNRVAAELIYKSDVVYAWVEEGQTVDRAALQASLERFSQRTYFALTAAFGNEWKPGVDNDVRLHILHTTQTSNGIAGYYSSADEYSRLANPFSNEKEMFYINLNHLNSKDSFADYEQVLAHELQHMIHWNQDRNEGVWLNEGLSEAAQDLAGYPQNMVFVNAFLQSPDTQLNSWNPVNQSNLAHYGASYLLVKYLQQRFGQEFIRLLLAQPANGIDGINQVFQQTALSQPMNFDDVFADWVVANFADDPPALVADGRYGYQELDLNKIQPATFSAQPTFTVDAVSNVNRGGFNGQVYNYATVYLAVQQHDGRTLHFQGATQTELASVRSASGRFMAWSNRGDESNSRLTRRLDLRSAAADATLRLEASMWWQIEDGYDYGYVLASRDGRKWDILPGTDAITANIAGNGFGAGYSGNSQGWRRQSFDLGPYAGQEIWLRFEYVTDDAVHQAGWWIDDVAIPAIGYFDDFEGDLAGWQSEGWLFTDNQLRQRWLVQALLLEDQHLTALKRYPVDDSGQATLDLGEIEAQQQAILAISALTGVTTEPASFQIR